MSPLDDMCKKIDEKMVPQTDDDTEDLPDDDSHGRTNDDSALKEFIPETVLGKLISLEAVENVLRHSKDHHKLQLGTPIPELAQWFSKYAFKVFAILAKNNQLHLIEHLYHKHIRDDMLPVRMRWLNEKKRRYEIKPCNMKLDGDKRLDENTVREAFCCGPNSPWGPDPTNGIYLFYNLWQWPLLPPVFIKDQFRYEFQLEVRLPFTRIGARNLSPNSLYSYVQERSIHADHLPKNLEIAVDDQGNPRVAIKELRQQGDNFESVANGEANVLEMMKGLDSEHLIKAIAYYRKGKEHCFMFPWAEKGNIWDFWTKNTPSTERSYIIWVFRQLIGLTGAIEKLHHGDGEMGLDSNCRHGDLKPENILCFKTKDGKEDNPRLVITDVGLAKVHNKATDLRKRTAPTVSTKRYAPPELTIDPNTPKSRRFDVWSLGCIFLEFVIWLLYRAEKLEEFCKVVDPFYEIATMEVGYEQHLSPISKKKIVQTAKVHDEMKDWISYMINNDWRCSEGTALRRLIDLIDTRMLKIPLLDPKLASDSSSKLGLSPRKQASDSHLLVATQMESLTSQSGVAAQTSILAVERTVIAEPDSVSNTPGLIVAGTPTEEPDSSLKHLRQVGKSQTSLMAPQDCLSRDPRFRAYVPEIREKLEEILALLEAGEGIGDRSSEDAPDPPPGPSTEGKIKNSGHLGIPESTQVGWLL